MSVFGWLHAMSRPRALYAWFLSPICMFTKKLGSLGRWKMLYLGNIIIIYYDPCLREDIFKKNNFYFANIAIV